MYDKAQKSLAMSFGGGLGVPLGGGILGGVRDPLGKQAFGKYQFGKNLSSGLFDSEKIMGTAGADKYNLAKKAKKSGGNLMEKKNLGIKYFI